MGDTSELELRRQHGQAIEAYERYMRKARGALAHAERVEAELDSREQLRT